MASARCSCGFCEAGDETIDDHLIEVFAPDDGKGPDGKVHLEGEANLFCLCGAGGSAAELDAHLLAVLNPGRSRRPGRREARESRVMTGAGLSLAYGVAETTHMEKYWEPPP
jgi:hypothetical protein